MWQFVRATPSKGRNYGIGLRAALFALSAGCGPVSQAHSQTIIIDDWWNVDFAKTCLPTEQPCVHDSTAEVRQFEDQIVAAFVTDERCHNLSVSIFGRLASSPPPSFGNNRWTLSFNYRSGYVTQPWTVVNDGRVALEGIGDAGDIAQRICVAASRRGASEIR